MGPLPKVTVRISGNLYELDDVVRYIKKNNLYQASKYIVENTGIGKDYATKLALAIREYWQQGYDPIHLSCALVGKTRATARFTVRPDEEIIEEKRRKKEAEEKAAAEAEKKAKEKAELDALSEEEKLLLRIRKVNELVKDKEVTEELNEIEEVVLKIIARVKQNPKTKNVIDEFYEQYLPKTVEISENYAKIYATGIDNEESRELKAKLIESLDGLQDAFKNMYEKTYDEDMLRLASDIAALNNRLSYDGLTKSDFDISE